MDDARETTTIPAREIQTQQVDTGQFNPELREKFKALGNTYSSNEQRLVLFFPSHSEPHITHITDTDVSLGRTDVDAGINPSIDLTPYKAGMLGVSRFHAIISVINGQFHIKDMGSTNGTRINGRKMDAYLHHPFKSGDALRLGHLSVLVG